MQNLSITPTKMSVCLDDLCQEIGFESLTYILELFVSEVPNYQSQLTGAPENQAASACHNLKIHLTTFGALEIANRARELEASIRSQAHDLDRTCQALAAELTEVAIQITDYLDARR